VIARYRGTVKLRYFRGDAAFANPEIYEFLEAEGYGYAIRLPTNHVLQSKIGYLLKRPPGRPPDDSWTGNPAVWPRTEVVAIEFGCGGTSRDGGSGLTGRESGECRFRWR